MSGFVANSPADIEQTIQNTGFYPDISPADCRDAMRIDSAITSARLRQALINAISNANRELAIWEATKKTVGYNTLATVPAEHIDGKSTLEHLYHRAVFHAAKAEIVEQYRDYDSTQNASQRAEELDETIDQYRRESILALARIVGRPQTVIELI